MTNFDRCTEAELFAIYISQDSKSITLSLCDVLKARFFLLAFGVRRFLTSELRETNIVDRVNLWHKDNWSDHSQDSLEEFVAGSQDRVLMKSVIADELQLIRQGANILVEIEAVYGATIMILCERFSVADQI